MLLLSGFTTLFFSDLLKVSDLFHHWDKARIIVTEAQLTEDLQKRREIEKFELFKHFHVN